MHIRLATPSDFSSTASMSVDSFWNDELYVYANPRREQYPDDFRDAFLRRHRLRYWLPDYIFQVAVTDPGDDDNDPGGRVVGHAIWIRNGSSEEARKWHTHSYWGSLQCALLKTTDVYLDLIRADRSLDYPRLASFIEVTKDSFDIIPELWKLQTLCVHVDYQRRGIASMFLKWGQEQAQREGCPIGLESSAAAKPMYLKNGFRQYGKIHIPDFPFEDVVFLWEPKGMGGKWGVEEMADRQIRKSGCSLNETLDIKEHL